MQYTTALVNTKKTALIGLVEMLQLVLMTNMYLLLFVENIAPIQEIDTANCIHFKLNSVVLNIHIDKKDNAKTNSIAFNIYFSFILL